VTAELGKRYRLTQHIGYNPGYAVEDQQDRHAPLFDGQEAEVVAIVPPGEHGAGPVDEATIVLALEHHELGDHRDHAASAAEGRHVGLDDPPRAPTGVTRHWSCTESQLAEWFTEISELDPNVWQPDPPSAPETT
jgi:hypothetical protein